MEKTYTCTVFGTIYEPMYEYKGFTILKNTKPILAKDCRYINSEGKVINRHLPVFTSLAKKGKRYNNIHSPLFGGDGREPNEFDVKYTEEQIDNYLENRKKYVLEKFKEHRSGKIRRYILNNVTITTIFLEGEYKHIFVNQRQLRYASLSSDSTFKDVLCQVYINTIAKYNVWELNEHDLPTYIKDIEEEKIDLSVLPLYEYINLKVKLNDEEFIIRDVSETRIYDDERYDFKLKTDDEYKYIKVEDIPKMSVLGEDKSVRSIQGLMNKVKFYE